MADHLLTPLVIGECDIAVGATRYGPAIETIHERSISTAVQHDDRLFTTLNGLALGFYRTRRKQT
jgi:hypothetical protein